MLSVLSAATGCSRMERTSGELTHEAYVWQRNWRPEVSEAVAGVGREGSGVAGVVALAAEIDFPGGTPRAARIRLDHAALAEVADRGGRVGLALRIGATPDLFADNPVLVDRLAGLAAGLVAEARAGGVELDELQVDHDCPTSRLADCATVVRAVARAVAPLPTVFTALPSWLEDPQGFRRMAAAADGFVLQVHGLAVSPGAEPSLWNPAAALTAVEEAARFGRPFRAALPTFGHLVAVDGDGRVVAVASEDAPAELTAPDPFRQAVPEAGPTWTVLTAEPADAAALVRHWTASRPAALQGVVWYRLPVAGDRLNWSGDTLAAVTAGRAPAPRWEVTTRSPEPGLVEVALVNRGDAAAPPPPEIALAWGAGVPLTADGLAGYRFDAGGRRLVRPPVAVYPHAVGEARDVAWLRFADPREVSGEVR